MKTTSHSTLRLLLLALAVSGLSTSAFAANTRTWSNAATNVNWTTGADWGGTAPGTTVGTTSADTALFNSAVGTVGTSGNPIIIDSGTQNVAKINFTTSAGSYTIGSSSGSNSLFLSSGGNVEILAAFTGTNATETINAPLVIEGAYTIGNLNTSNTNSLVINGSVSPGVSGTTTLTLTGTTTGGATVFNGGFTDGSGTLSITTGVGITQFTHSATYSGTTSLANASTILQVGNNNALGTSILSWGNSTAQIQALGGPVTLPNTLLEPAAGTSVAVGGSQNITFNGALNWGGSNTVNISNTGATTFAGGVVLRDGGGFFTDATPNSQRSITFSTGSGAGVLTVGPISNGTALNGIVTSNGSGTTVFNGNNIYTGTTTVGAGNTLQLQSSTALGTGGTGNVNGTTSITAGGTIDLDGQTINESITANGAGVGSNGSLINSNTGTTAVIGGGVANFTGYAAGSNYSAPPTISITNGGGATGTASLGITAATLGINTSSGTYSVAPTITITGGGGSNAVATITTAGVVSIGSIGTGYTSAPTVTISGGTLSSGTAWTATPSGSAFVVSAMTLTNVGTGVTGATSVVFTNGVGDVTGSGAGAATTNSTLVLGTTPSIGGAGNIRIDGPITGNNLLTKVGAGTLIINNTDSDTAGVAISAGTLQVGNGGTTGSLGTGGISNSGTLVYNRSDASLTDSNVISGAGTVKVTGGGSVKLSGSSSYTGPTNIVGGTLIAATLAASSSNSSIGAATATASNLVLDNGTLQYAGGGGSTDHNFNFGNATTASGGGIDNEGTGALTYSGSLTNVNTAAGTQTFTLTANTGSGSNVFSGTISDGSGSALTALAKSGAGSWTLTGSNGYTAGTTINAGTLNVGTGGSLGTGGVTDNGSLVYASSGNITDGNLIGGTGNVSQTGASVLSLSNVGSTYSGATTVGNGSTLKVAKLDDINTASSIGKGSSSGAATDLVLDGGLLQYVGTVATSTNRPFTMTANGATLDASGTGAGTLAFSGALTNSASSGTQTLTLQGSGTGSTGGGTIGGLISNGTGSSVTNVAKTGGGDWTISGTSNTYSGTTSVGGGTLALTANGAAGNTSAVNITSGSLIVGAGTTDAINSTAAVNITAGATLAVNGSGGSGTAQTVGALTLLGSGASHISFGSGTSTLTFGSDVNGAGWDSTATLDIDNWVGGSTQIILGSLGTSPGSSAIGTGGGAGFTSAQLASITWTNATVNGLDPDYVGAAIVYNSHGQYELEPAAVPEPTTIFAGLCLVALLGWRSRRQILASLS